MIGHADRDGRSETHTLRNDGLEVTFGPRGGLRTLVDRTTGRDYIAEAGRRERPLFVMHCVEILRGRILPGEIVLQSMLADSVEVTQSEQRLSFEFQRIDGQALEASCAVSIDERAPFLRFALRVTNGTPMAIRSIDFPVLVLTAQLGLSAQDDRILLPKEDGQLLGNPHVVPWDRIGGRGEDQRYFYPGEGRQAPLGLSAQVLAYYDPEGGLYLGTHDAAGNVKKLGPVWLEEEGQTGIDFTPAHWLPEVRRARIDIPYDTVLGFFTGDWQDAAAIYKQWALGQPWCARKLAERSDVPDWIKRGALFFSFRLRFQDGGASFLDRVPEFLSRWRQALGAPLVAMMSGWEKIGEWAGPDYFPPFGGHERFHRMCAHLRHLGIRVFPFGLSALKLLLRRKVTAASAQPELQVDYDDWESLFGRYFDCAVREVGGEALLDSQVDAWDGLHAYACVATEQARSQLRGASLTLAESYGATVSQADQLLCGSTPACYSTHHGHDPGRGQWQIESLKRIYDETRRDCKQVDPEFALSQEWICEPFIQALDIYHGRNYDQTRGLVGVPLFSFLYHEFIPCFGGDWASFLPDNPSGIYYHAVNLVNGNLPAGSPLSLWTSVDHGLRNATPDEADSSILRMARNASGAFLAFPEFFVLGEMLRAAPLQVPPITVRFFGHPFGWTRRPMTLPCVLHGGWKAPDGRRGYVFANIGPDARSFPFLVSAGASAGPRNLSLSRNGGSADPVASGVMLPHVVDMALEPQDAVLLIERAL